MSSPIVQPIALASVSSTPSLARGDGYWARARRRLLRNRLATASLTVILAMIVIALIVPVLGVLSPSNQNLSETFQKPSLHHLMGTDNLGRDWFSRLIYGARVSLSVGIFTQVIVLGIGLPVGLMAGFMGKTVDSVLMRFTDLVYAFPDLLLVILLRSVLGGNIFTLFFIIGIVSWVDIARLVRGQVLALREREFVEAARSLGASNREIMTRHLLPNISGPLIVVVAFGVPRAIFIEASLSFIGVGVNSRTTSWGSMVQEGYSAIFSFPHLVLFPSIAIALLMLAFTFLGDGLRDAMDPRTEATLPRDDAEVKRSVSKAPSQPQEQPRAA